MPSTGISHHGNAKGSREGAKYGMDGKWLARALKEIGRSQTDLAHYLGLQPPQVNKSVMGKRAIKSEEADRIREYIASARAHSSESFLMRHADAGDKLPERHEMPEDVPVLGTVVGGSLGGGDFTMNGETTLYVRRPPRLSGRKDVFGLFTQGDSMSPRYMPGELIYLETARPPAIGDHVVVEMKAGADGTQPAYLKRLVAMTPTKLRLAQYNPEKTIEIERGQVLRVIRVMTLSDLLGV